MVTWVSGSLLSIALLVWVFRGADALAIWQAIRDLSAWAVLASCLVICLSIPLRAQQWRWLLDGAPEVTAGLALRGICLGNLINGIVPARAGEVFKAWLLARWSGLPVSRVLVSLVIARVLDLGCVLVLLGLMFAIIPISDGIAVDSGALVDHRVTVSREGLVALMRTFTVIAFVSFTLLVGAGLQRARVGRWVGACLARVAPAWVRPWADLWAPVEQALGVMRSGGHLWGAVVLSLLCWIVFALTPLPMLLSLGLGLSEALVATLAISGLTTLAQLVPTAPLALGTFHAACLLGLTLSCPEIDRDKAVAFTLVVHLADTVTAAIPGLLLVPGAWAELRSAHKRARPYPAKTRIASP